MERVVYTELESPIGSIFLAGGEKGLVRLSIGRGEDEFLSQFPPHFELIKDDEVLKTPIDALSRYFAGERVSFANIPLILSGTPFQMRVWRALLEIPYGKLNCHRVVAVDGLGGFGPGLSVKQYLLKLEGAI